MRDLKIGLGGELVAATLTAAPVRHCLTGYTAKLGNLVVAAKLGDHFVGGAEHRGRHAVHASTYSTFRGTVNSTKRRLVALPGAALITGMIETGFPPQSAQAIGVRLRLTRDAIGITSREMAARCGILEKNLSAYMSGQNLLKPDVAIKIINAFAAEHLDFNWLYHGKLGGTNHSFATRVEALVDQEKTAKAS